MDEWINAPPSDSEDECENGNLIGDFSKDHNLFTKAETIDKESSVVITKEISEDELQKVFTFLVYILLYRVSIKSVTILLKTVFFLN